MSAHTPIPWVVDFGMSAGHIKSVVPGAEFTPTVARYDDGNHPLPLIAHSISEEERKANAAFIVEAVNSHDKLKARVEKLEAALEFYADPDTYFAIAVWADRPCGEFADDFDDTGELGERPGKRARANGETP